MKSGVASPMKKSKSTGMEVALEWGPDEANLICVALKGWHSLTPWLRYEKRNWRVMSAHRSRGDMGRVGGVLAHWRRSAMTSKEYNDLRDKEREAISVAFAIWLRETLKTTQRGLKVEQFKLVNRERRGQRSLAGSMAGIIGRSNLGMCFRRWVYKVMMGRRRLRAQVRLIQRVELRLASCAMSTWLEARERFARLGKECGYMIARSHRRMCLAAIEAWGEALGELKEHKRRIEAGRRILVRIRARFAAAVMGAWGMAARRAGKLMGAKRACEGRGVLWRMHVHFAALAVNAIEESRERGRGGRARARAERKYMMWGWDVWAETVGMLKRHAVVVTRTVGTGGLRLGMECFLRWREASDASRRDRSMAARSSERARRRRILAAFRGWSSSWWRYRKLVVAAERVWGKHTLGVLHSSMGAWREITSGSRLFKSQGSMVARKVAKVGALVAFGAWQRRVGGLERVKRLALKALGRLKAVRRGRAFWGWWEEVEAGRAERERGHWKAERLQREDDTASERALWEAEKEGWEVERARLVGEFEAEQARWGEERRVWEGERAQHEESRIALQAAVEDRDGVKEEVREAESMIGRLVKAAEEQVESLKEVRERCQSFEKEAEEERAAKEGMEAMLGEEKKVKERVEGELQEALAKIEEIKAEHKERMEREEAMRIQVEESQYLYSAVGATKQQVLDLQNQRDTLTERLRQALADEDGVRRERDALSDDISAVRGEIDTAIAASKATAEASARRIEELVKDLETSRKKEKELSEQVKKMEGEAEKARVAARGELEKAILANVDLELLMDVEKRKIWAIRTQVCETLTACEGWATQEGLGDDVGRQDSLPPDPNSSPPSGFGGAATGGAGGHSTIEGDTSGAGQWLSPPPQEPTPRALTTPPSDAPKHQSMTGSAPAVATQWPNSPPSSAPSAPPPSALVAGSGTTPSPISSPRKDAAAKSYSAVGTGEGDAQRLHVLVMAMLRAQSLLRTEDAVQTARSEDLERVLAREKKLNQSLTEQFDQAGAREEEMAKELTAVRERLTRGENVKEGESSASKQQVMRLEKELAAAIMAGERERKGSREAERQLSASHREIARLEEQLRVSERMCKQAVDSHRAASARLHQSGGLSPPHSAGPASPRPTSSPPQGYLNSPSQAQFASGSTPPQRRIGSGVPSPSLIPQQWGLVESPRHVIVVEESRLPPQPKPLILLDSSNNSASSPGGLSPPSPPPSHHPARGSSAGPSTPLFLPPQARAGSTPSRSPTKSPIASSPSRNPYDWQIKQPGSAGTQSRSPPRSPPQGARPPPQQQQQQQKPKTTIGLTITNNPPHLVMDVGMLMDAHGHVQGTPNYVLNEQVDVGDKLVRINGVDVTNLAIPSMIGLLDGDVDDCVLLAFERSKTGRMYAVSVRRRALSAQDQRPFMEQSAASSPRLSLNMGGSRSRGASPPRRPHNMSSPRSPPGYSPRSVGSAPLSPPYSSVGGPGGSPGGLNMTIGSLM